MGARRIIGNTRGQAAIEMGFSLPLLIFMLYWTLNAFHTIHSSHIAQKHAATSMYQRLNNRAKFVVDDEANVLFDKQFIAVQYRDPNEPSRLPRRRILLSPLTPIEINSIVGICREPGCN